MKTIRTALSLRFSEESLDVRLGQLVCYLAAVAILPTSVVALVRHPGSRADFLFGLGLACLVALLSAMLGTLCRHSVEWQSRLSLRTRWPEFASYVASLGTLVTGISWIANLGLNPSQITVGLLLTCALSMAVLVLGMMTSLVRSQQG